MFNSTVTGRNMTFRQLTNFHIYTRQRKSLLKNKSWLIIINSALGNHVSFKAKNEVEADEKAHRLAKQIVKGIN